MRSAALAGETAPSVRLGGRSAHDESARPSRTRGAMISLGRPRTACDAAAPNSSKTIPAYAHSFSRKKRGTTKTMAPGIFQIPRIASTYTGSQGSLPRRRHAGRWRDPFDHASGPSHHLPESQARWVWWSPNSRWLSFSKSYLLLNVSFAHCVTNAMIDHNAHYQRTRRRQFNEAWNMRLPLQSLHCSGSTARR